VTTALAAKQFESGIQDNYVTGTDIVIDQRTSETVEAVVGNQEVEQDAVFWGEQAADWQPTTFDEISHDWFNQSVMPFYNLHKGKVYQEAIAEAQADPDVGVLTKTCAKGTECRNQKRAALQLSLETQWKTLMKNFKTSVSAQLVTTKGEIIETYKDFKQCADDFPCCETNEVTVKNWYTSMENYQRAVYKRLIAIKELNARITEIEVECPEVLDIVIDYDTGAQDDNAGTQDVDTGAQDDNAGTQDVDTGAQDDNAGAETDAAAQDDNQATGPIGKCWVKMNRGCAVTMNDKYEQIYEHYRNAEHTLESKPWFIHGDVAESQCGGAEMQQ